MRKALVAAIAAGLMISAPPAQSAPTVAQRRELAAIRREVLKAPALLRRKKTAEARKTLLEADKRLKKLLDAAVSFDDSSARGKSQASHRNVRWLGLTTLLSVAVAGLLLWRRRGV